MAKIDAAEVKSLCKKFKDSDQKISYAFGVGAKPEESGFIVHKSKKPAILMAEMKGDKSFKKVGCGTIQVKGTTLHITETKKVSALERQLTKLLKGNGVKLVPQVAADGADGDDAKTQATEKKMIEAIEQIEKEIDDLIKQAV